MLANNADAPVVERSRMFPRWLPLLALGLTFLLFVPWLQRAFWLTQCPGQVGENCEQQWDDLRWTFVIEAGLSFGVILVGLAMRRAGELDRMSEKIASYITKRVWCTAATVLSAVLLPLSAAYFVLDRFPNSSDEFSYLFEAHTLSGLRLWEAPPVLGTDLIAHRTFIFDSKWVSQYPPGWPMMLSLGLLLGIPAWMVNSLIGGGSVAVLIALCRRVGAHSAAVVAAALFAFTPFYVMNAASYFPHVFSSLLILLFCFFLLRGSETVQAYKLIAAGATVGLLGMTRYFDVLPLIPSMLFWFFQQSRKEWPRIIGLLAAGFIPFLTLLMIYQFLITGSPFRSSYFVIDVPEVSEILVGLDPVRIKDGMMISVGRVAELALWTSPVLILGYFFCMLLKFQDRKLTFYDLIFPTFVLAYVAFANLGGNRYGPRYYFEAYPLMMLTIVSALPSINARIDRSIDRSMLPINLVACLLYLFGTWPLVITGFRLEVFSRQEPFRLAKQLVTGNAVVIQDTASALGLHYDDLVRNPLSMDAPVLFARSDADIAALREAFPGRSIWRYSRPDTTLPGKLERIDSSLEP